MSFHRSALIFLLSAGLAGAALWACGPFFPPWLLTSEAGILEAPTTWLRDALEPLLPAGEPPFPALRSEDDPYAQTLKAEQADLAAALEGLPADRRAALLERHRQFRETLTRVGNSEEAAKAKTAGDAAALKVPDGLPGEFADYLAGAVAFYEGREDAARAAWEKLLARPAAERRQRSTWAAFMLGKSALAVDAAAAVRWFERTRELASQGFADSLGLAESSLGWQARAEMSRGRFDEALKLYLQQQKAGDPTALPSIRRAAARALGDEKGLARVARSPEARAVFTAWILSDWSRKDYDGPLEGANAARWLAAVRAAGVTQADGADRLAWAAYRAGDFAAAEEWAKRAPASASAAPMAAWVRAKLMLRAGKLAEGEALLAQVVPALPESPARKDHDFWQAYESGVQPPFRPRAAGERGAVRLARGEYAGALDDLLRGGWWTDAAYVAERVMTVDELRAYADAAWPAALAAHYQPGAQKPVDEPGEAWELLDAGLAPPPGPRIAHNLRDLLGRRLVRAGRLAEARAYLPEEQRAPLDDLARSLAAGRDARRPAAERSASLFRAACLTRYQGMELSGTEIEPDWDLFGGSLEASGFAALRADPKTHSRLAPGADERRRVAASAAAPEKRFHYRYRGMALAEEAAKLLPAGSEERARVLATAGNWVEGRDPAGARPLYDAIQSCCAGTAIARRSRKVHAITNIEDACPADTLPKEDGGR